MDDMIHYDCGCKFGWVGQMMMRAGPAAAAAAAPIPANHPGSGSFKVHNVFFFLQWKYSAYLNWPALGFFTLCKYCKKAKILMTLHLLNNLKGIILWLGEMEFNNVKKKWFRTQQLKQERTGGLIEKSCVAQRLLSLDYLWVFFCSTLTLKSKLCQDQDNCELITAVCKRGDTRIWEGGWAELKYEVRKTMQENSRARAPIGTCRFNIPTDQPTNQPTERHDGS